MKPPADARWLTAPNQTSEDRPVRCWVHPPTRLADLADQENPR